MGIWSDEARNTWARQLTARIARAVHESHDDRCARDLADTILDAIEDAVEQREADDD
jgi:hypothetical protein